MASLIRDRDTSGMPAPPDVVQFNNGMPQFSFQLQGGNTIVPNLFGISNNSGQFTGGNITLQLPLPTPIASFTSQPSNVQSHPEQQLGMSTSNQQQAQQQQQFVTQNAANFAQLFAQQAGNMLQQQSIAARQQQQQPQPVPLRPLLPSVMQIQQQQAAQRPQQAMPAQPPTPMPFSADPNAFLQQLQFAQMQQQLRAAPPQQQQLIPCPTTQQQQPPPPPTLSNQPITNPATGPKRVSKAGGTKKTSTRLPPQPKLAANSDLAFSSMVSASDTDGEATRRVKLKKSSQSESKKMKLAELSAADLSNMTEAEKAKANRDRNREHARNTRLRKKAYLEKLKASVDDLCRERDSLVSERASAANLLIEMHNTRTEVLMSFFALRTSNEKRRKLWSSVLDESCFTLIMPITPYRSFPASEVQLSKCLRNIMGVDGMMSDTASLHLLLDTLVDRSTHPLGKISFRYTLVTEDAVVAGNQLMARWIMTTTNAVECGAKLELSKQGMLCCKFNSAHKIIGMELIFDVMAFMLQIKQAHGSDGFTVMPNTVQTCQRSFDKPMVVTIAEPPYTIIQVNKLWTEMTGYTAEEVVRKHSCSLLQPSHMDKKSLKGLMQELRHKRPASAALDNVTKSGAIFTNFLTVVPLSTDSRIAYFLGLTEFHRKGPLILPEEAATVSENLDSSAVKAEKHATGVQSFSRQKESSDITPNESRQPPTDGLNSTSPMLAGLKRVREDQTTDVIVSELNTEN